MRRMSCFTVSISAILGQLSGLHDLFTTALYTVAVTVGSLLLLFYSYQTSQLQQRPSPVGRSAEKSHGTLKLLGNGESNSFIGSPLGQMLQGCLWNVLGLAD